MESEPTQPTATPEEPSEPITKPKRKHNISDEQRQALAERMRKVNQARIEKAKLANEATLLEKEKKVAAKLESIKEKKEKVREIKEKVETVQPTEPKKEPKKKTKKVVITESSDSEDYGEEVVYVQKKVKPRSETMTKPKVAKSAPAVAEPPKCVYKFV